LTRQNVTGTAEFQNFSFNYASIPEPSTGLLAGGAIGAALLRRRRTQEDNKE
jgi:hypothetical protein